MSGDMGDTLEACRDTLAMAWKVTTPMKERKQFVDAWLRADTSVAELCRRFGISRKTGYKWISRRHDDGDAAFADRSRRPHSNPRAIEPALVDQIVALRKERPTWGPRKLRAILQKVQPRATLPAVSTFASVLKRHGLIRPRRRRSRTAAYSAPLGHAKAPNMVWSIDFKGHFEVAGARCYPLTVTCNHSRYLIACVALRNTRTATVQRAMERIFREFGLPDAIRSDNGEPFASVGVAGLTQLSTWWMKLGIRHERIEPGHPEQNGRHERMHLTLKQDTASPPQRSMAAQQRAFDLFRALYNDERPHEALGMKPPSAFYEPSRRVLPEPAWGRDFEYPLDYETARVAKNGRVHATIGTLSPGAAVATNASLSRGVVPVCGGSGLRARSRKASANPVCAPSPDLRPSAECHPCRWNRSSREQGLTCYLCRRLHTS